MFRSKVSPLLATTNSNFIPPNLYHTIATTSNNTNRNTSTNTSTNLTTYYQMMPLSAKALKEIQDIIHKYFLNIGNWNKK